MKTAVALFCSLCCGLVCMPFATARKSPDAPDAIHIRATVDLADGSRLVGEPVVDSLPVTLDFAQLDIPLHLVRDFEVRHRDDTVTVLMTNGDRYSGRLQHDSFELQTSLGRLTPPLKMINHMSVSSWREGNMPPGDGDVFFGGVNWLKWRTDFEQQGDKLVSLPRARPGFNYGHGGNGRGPNLMTNIGNSDWKNYSIEAEFCVTGVDPALNPYGLGNDYHDGVIMFHVADAKESHNERGMSGYHFAVHGTGDWDLRRIYNSYCNQPVGWGSPYTDGELTVATGHGLRVDRVNGNKYRIDVHGNRIEIWVDGEQILDIEDEHMEDFIGGQRLDHGGVGFGGGFDAMIWVRNFSARLLTE